MHAAPALTLFQEAENGHRDGGTAQREVVLGVTNNKNSRAKVEDDGHGIRQCLLRALL